MGVSQCKQSINQAGYHCVTRWGFLTIVTLIQQFRPYLLGRHFIIRTEPGSLTWLSNFKQPEGELTCWIERLNEYNFIISHHPGHKYQNADAMSRRLSSQCGRESHDKESVLALIVEVPTTSHLVDKFPEELCQKHFDDGPIQLFLKAKEKNEKP